MLRWSGRIWATMWDLTDGKRKWDVFPKHHIPAYCQYLIGQHIPLNVYYVAAFGGWTSIEKKATRAHLQIGATHKSLYVKQREKPARPNHTAAVLPHNCLNVENCDDKPRQNKDPACLEEWKQIIRLFFGRSPCKMWLSLKTPKTKAQSRGVQSPHKYSRAEIMLKCKTPKQMRLGDSRGHAPNFAAVINQEYCHVSPCRTRTNCSFKYFSGRHKSVFMATLGRYGGRLANMKIKSSLGCHPSMLSCVES